MLRLTRKKLLVALALLVPVAALAIVLQIRISDLRDINFGTVSPTAGQLDANHDICVSMNQPGLYSVIGRGTGPNDSFVLNSGPYALPYLVFMSDKAGRPSTTPMTAGTPLTGLRAKKRKKKADCNKPDANLAVRIEAAALAQTPAGSYSGTLMLTVIPE